MAYLDYKSLVTKETIDYYLSKIKDDDDKKQKKDLLSTISKFDIRISTKPVIKDDEFYYKIWILRRGTKKKIHVKEYYHLSLLNKKSNSSSPLSLSEILEMVRMNADVPDDFEEYCENWFRDPSDRIYRIDYLADLRRAKRLKKFFSKEEIKSIPFLPNDDRNENVKDKNIDSIIDFNNKSDLKLLGYSVIYLNDKKEYDKLAELTNSLEYHTKIVKSYGYNSYTGDVDEKKFPVTKEDKQMKGIKKDFDNYFQALEEYNEYLKELVKKYDIKPTGNLVKRLAFNIHVNDDYNGSNSKQQQHPEFIISVIDFKDFSDV